ncbi:glycosyltransferase family 2 protein [Candidatus Berkelbacteria bacterium]|nr:glycosyltransferase family 2 protein [Candidatus Berkelbacteria bacterium]
MKRQSFKISVIIPVYNEKNTILEALKRVLDVNLDKEIIIIDDGSIDGTRQILKKLKHSGVRIIYQEKNQGKGAALKRGIAEANGDYVVFQDADLEYDPGDFFNLLGPVKKSGALAVYGSRFRGNYKNMIFFNMLGNRLITFMANLLFRSNISDEATCYKLLETKLAKSIEVNGNGFEFEPELTAKILKKGIKIYEVPISYIGRGHREGKKINWRDGLRALWTLVKYRFVD